MTVSELLETSSNFNGELIVKVYGEDNSCIGKFDYVEDDFENSIPNEFKDMKVNKWRYNPNEFLTMNDMLMIKVKMDQRIAEWDSYIKKFSELYTQFGK